MLIGLACLLLLLVALLAIPLDVRFSGQWHDDEIGGRVTIAWMFGLVPVRPDVGRSFRRSEHLESLKEKPLHRRGRYVVAMLRTEGFGQGLMRFVLDILRTIHLKALSLRGRLGLGDPADTGRVWAFVGPLTGTLAGVRGTDISIEPDFEGIALDFDGSGEIRVIPVQLLVLLVGFIVSPATLRALWAAFASRSE